MTPLVLLAGGGTVGHLAPGFALRAELAARGVRAVFVTPGEPRERPWFAAADDVLHVPAPRFPRRPLGLAAFGPRLLGSTRAALALLRRTRPAAVVALGGWPCAPTAIAALLARVPLFLVSSDAVPGLVVRRLGRHATRTWVATEEAAAALPFPDRVFVVGRAVRRDVLEAERDATRFGLLEGKATLLVTGGSLGARALNDAVRRGLQAGARLRPGLRDRLQVIHSAGSEEDAAAAREAYGALGLAGHVVPYLRDMGTALATCDLVLSRAGASTVAEIEALDVPAVLVPYPHHADRQQYRNAEPLVRRGQAVLVEESALEPAVFGREVIERCLSLADSPRPRSGARGSAAGPAAAMADDLLRLLRVRSERGRSVGGAFPGSPPRRRDGRTTAILAGVAGSRSPA